MLSIKDLSYYIGGRPIYKDASFHINERDKIGLVGPNGSGKTTLLKIILGDLSVDEGRISKSKGCTIGLLDQEIGDVNESAPILSIAMQAFEPLLKMKERIDMLLHQIEKEPSQDNIKLLSELQENFELNGGYTLQAQAEEILEGIGFSTTDLLRPLSEFSGGWKMRVVLAKLLLEKPSILMLDEPTNHLDLPSIKWFENYIRSYDGAVIIVSHDKQFLDNIVDKICEIEDGKLITYNGNYSDYLKEKSLRAEIQTNAHLNQQKKIREAEKFINRFRAKATKARQVQSKIKLMNKIELVEQAREDTRMINFEFRLGQESGKHVMDIRDLSKSYGETTIFQHANASIMRGDKVALIGANGLGKSTLLKIIAGTIPYQGSCIPGHNVHLAYYAQHQIDGLHYDNNILEELMQTESNYTELELRTVLGSFLFSGDDVFKKIENLSGGEKARVALAKVLISKANFLVMDEPTNHLDIQSVDILSVALQQYRGTLIMVSHDRQFIDAISSKIWYIENKQVKEYPGTFSEYELRSDSPETGGIAKSSKKNRKPEKKHQSNSYEEQKKLKNQLNGLKNKLEELEQSISKLETRKAALEKQMLSPDVAADYERLKDFTEDLEAINTTIDEHHRSWEKVFMQIEAYDTEDN